jgi:DNA-binding beta-propeller fold protein YncE
MARRHRHRRPKETGQRSPIFLIVAAAVLVAAAGALVAAPTATRLLDATSLAPAGAVGYVVCPTTVTPVELETRTAEAPIPLPLGGTPVLGTFAIATSPDGKWAYVATTDGVAGSGAASSAGRRAGVSTGGHLPVGGVGNVLIPVDLVTQRALAPIPLPGQGGSHAVVVEPDGRTVLVADGSSIVPVDPANRTVGAPIDLGAGRTVFGMALDPSGSVLDALVPDGVIPVDLVHDTARPEVMTGLAVSSVYSPHGIVVSSDGTTIYVAGQGGEDYGGRVVPIDAATGALLPEAGFDAFGIADPAALTLAGDDVLVADAANNWVNPVPLSSFTDPPPPVRLPSRPGKAAITGTEHPTDVVSGPGATGAFIVDGFDAVVPYQPTTEAFGRPIPVCSGATSMAVAPAP